MSEFTNLSRGKRQRHGRNVVAVDRAELPDPCATGLVLNYLTSFFQEQRHTRLCQYVSSFAVESNRRHIKIGAGAGFFHSQGNYLIEETMRCRTNNIGILT